MRNQKYFAEEVIFCHLACVLMGYPLCHLGQESHFNI